MHSDTTIIASDKLYIPAVHIDEDRVRKHYVKSFFVENVCRKCDHREDRPNDACQGCDAFNGTFKLANRRIVNNTEYFGIPLGDRKNIEAKLKIDFDDFDFVDKRCKNKFDYKIIVDEKKMKADGKTWRDIQVQTFLKMVKKKHGIFVLPPRSGKSLTLLKIGIDLGYKMLITADQYDFLKQFIGDIEKYTNLPELQKKHPKKKLYGFVKKPKDLKHIQIGIITYQSLINDSLGAKMKKACNKTFGSLFVDEVHSSCAPEFTRLINSMRCYVKIGCTGTIIRKDGKQVLAFHSIGPVQSDIKADQLTAKMMVQLTGIKSKRKFAGKAGFVYLGKFLANHDKRNAMILEWVEKDLEKGHSIVIPVHFKEHVDQLVKMINHAVGYEVAAPFVGGGTKKNKDYRDWVKEQASCRKIRVVVGIRSLLQRGINIVPWSCLYYVMPMNNPPNWKQESSRVLTIDDTGKKREPIIRFFVDQGVPASLSCFANTWKQTLEYKHKPTEEALKRAAIAIANVKTKGSPEEDPILEGPVVRTVPMATGGLFGSIRKRKK
jgi:superfamily II DNA or RNA helicase